MGNLRKLGWKREWRTRYGKARSGMGVDAADFDGDGWQDLFVANIDVELFSLYHNQKNLTFSETPERLRNIPAI